MVQTIDSFEVFLGLVMQLFGLFLKLLEASLGVDVNCILGNVANVEALFELLGSTSNALSHALETHAGQALVEDSSDQSGYLARRQDTARVQKVARAVRDVWSERDDHAGEMRTACDVDREAGAELMEGPCSLLRLVLKYTKTPAMTQPSCGYAWLVVDGEDWSDDDANNQNA
jgi:hypothetical protein